MIAIATLAIACDSPAAKTPDNNVEIPQPTTSASASPIPAATDAGAPESIPTNPEVNRLAPMYGLPPDSVPPKPGGHRAAPMYGLPPPSLK
ncbi:MAG: hypothetical protein ABI551_20210 [Polyangiaceae bacterium]